MSVGPIFNDNLMLKKHWGNKTTLLFFSRITLNEKKTYTNFNKGDKQVLCFKTTIFIETK